MKTHNAQQIGHEAIQALESSPQYSPPFSLVMRQDSDYPIQSQDLTQVESQDPSRHPFDEMSLPFEIRAALQDAIAALRHQADLLATKAREMQKHTLRHRESSDNDIQPPDEFGLPTQVTYHESSSEATTTGTSTPDVPSSDEESRHERSNRRPKKDRSRSESNQDAEVQDTQALEKLASPKRRRQGNNPGPSLLRNSNTSDSNRTTPASSSSKVDAQRMSESMSGPGGETVASAEKRVKFADEGVLDEEAVEDEPSESARPKSMMRSELEKRGHANQDVEEDGDLTDSDSDDPFPMDDDLDIPDEAPNPPPANTSHPAQDEQESEMFPARNAPSPSSSSFKQSMSPASSSKWSRLAAQHADQVAKLRDLLGADAPSHRENDDLHSFKKKRYGPSHHIGGKPRPIKSPARELPSNPFDESDHEEESGNDGQDAGPELDMARSMPISIMHPNGLAGVRYDMKTSLPTHEGLLIPHFERLRKQPASTSQSTSNGTTTKTEERAINQQLRQATQSAVSASLSRSNLDERHSAAAPSEPSAEAAAAFHPQRRSNYSAPTGPSSLSQSIPAEMLERLHAGVDEKHRLSSEDMDERLEEQEEEADMPDAPTDEMEFEGDEPKRFLPPHLWVRM